VVDLRPFYAAKFLAYLHNLENAIAQCGIDAIPEDHAKAASNDALKGFAGEFEREGFHRLASKAERLRHRIAHCAPLQTMELLAAFKDDVIHEMTADLYLRVPLDAKPYFLSVQFPPEAVSKFGKGLHDMTAASRCVALDEWDACVFHCMRVLELGLSALASHFSVRYAHENWRNIINDITGKIKGICQASHGSNWKEEEHYYSSVALHFQFLTNGWRNYVMHGRDTYDSRDAQQIFSHVRDFTGILAQRLDDSNL
jgi:hypothetical protein